MFTAAKKRMAIDGTGHGTGPPHRRSMLECFLRPERSGPRFFREIPMMTGRDAPDLRQTALPFSGPNDPIKIRPIRSESGKPRGIRSTSRGWTLSQSTTSTHAPVFRAAPASLRAILRCARLRRAFGAAAFAATIGGRTERSVRQGLARRAVAPQGEGWRRGWDSKVLWCFWTGTCKGLTHGKEV